MCSGLAWLGSAQCTSECVPWILICLISKMEFQKDFNWVLFYSSCRCRPNTLWIFIFFHRVFCCNRRWHLSHLELADRFHLNRLITIGILMSFCYLLFLIIGAGFVVFFCRCRERRSFVDKISWIYLIAFGVSISSCQNKHSTEKNDEIRAEKKQKTWTKQIHTFPNGRPSDFE